jgi:hypothetical protein
MDRRGRAVPVREVVGFIIGESSLGSSYRLSTICNSRLRTACRPALVRMEQVTSYVLLTPPLPIKHSTDEPVFVILVTPSCPDGVVVMNALEIVSPVTSQASLKSFAAEFHALHFLGPCREAIDRLAQRDRNKDRPTIEMARWDQSVHARVIRPEHLAI